MTEQDEVGAVRMLVKIADDNSFGDHYLQFTGEVLIQGQELRNPNECREDERGLAKLTVTAQMDTTAKGFYGFAVAYREPYRVTLDDAETMVKVLRKIRRKMTQLAERYGNAQDIATFAAYAMAALTADPQPFLRWVPAERDFAGTGYQAMGADGLRWYASDEIAKWRKEHPAHTSEEGS